MPTGERARLGWRTPARNRHAGGSFFGEPQDVTPGAALPDQLQRHRTAAHLEHAGFRALRAKERQRELHAPN